MLSQRRKTNAGAKRSLAMSSGEALLMAEEIEETENDVEKRRRQLAEMKSEFESRKHDQGNDEQKYELLFQREQEMTAFIDSFEKNKRAEQENLWCPGFGCSFINEDINKLHQQHKVKKLK